jgi:PKD repeat protein
MYGTRTDSGVSNGKGVSGPVVIKLADGSYKDLIFIGYIPGSSEQNTITITSSSGDSSKVLIHYPGDGVHETAYITFDEATNIIVEKVGFKAEMDGTKQAKYLALLYECKNITFKNNYFDSRDTSNSANNIGINIMGAGDSLKNITISNNYFWGGYISINVDKVGAGIKITNNIVNYSNRGIVLGSGNIEVAGNYIAAGTKSLGAAFCIKTSGTGEKKIHNNIIKLPYGGLGIELGDIHGNPIGPDTFDDTVIIYNNYVAGNASRFSVMGIFVGASHSKLCYNNINIIGNHGATVLDFGNIQYTSIEMFNNNFANYSDTTIIEYDPSLYPFEKFICDYNNYYTSKSIAKKLILTWPLSIEKHGISVDPAFSNSSVAQAGQLVRAGKAIPWVTSDYNGLYRDPYKPTIGADEYDTTQADAGILKYSEPYMCAGLNYVNARLKNFAKDTLKSCDISWTINGIQQPVYKWTGKIPPGNSALVSLGQYSFQQKRSYKLFVSTSSPNGIGDQNKANDSVTQILKIGMDSAYTIGAVNADYLSFSDAVSDLKKWGICQDIAFLVKDGHYNEQVLIDNSCTDKVHKITFQSESGDSSKVIVAYSQKKGQKKGTIFLNGASNINFRNITFSRNETVPDTGAILILNGENISLTGCDIRGGSLNDKLIAAGARNITIDQCFLHHGCMAFYSDSGKLITLRRNKIDTVNTGVYIDNSYYNFGTKHIIEDNTININGKLVYNGIVYPYTGAGIEVDEVDCGIIRRNKISVNEGVGLNIEIGDGIKNYYAANGYLTLRTKVYIDTSRVTNNSIVVTGSNNSSYGISINASSAAVCFNSIYIKAGTKSVGAIFRGENNFFNNCISNMDNGPALVILHDWHYGGGITKNCNLYSNGKDIVLDSIDNNPATRIAIKSYGSNNISVDPGYTSSSDLHASNYKLEAGISTTVEKYDIDGEKRDSLHPCIGADEIFIPKAFFSYSQTQCIGDTISFKDSSFAATKHKWYFGDGDSSDLVSPKHHYSSPGNYTIKLEVTSAKGDKDTTSQRVIIYSYPNPGFIYTNACLGDSLFFKDTSKSAAALFWKFGDGDSSYRLSPGHIYKNAGEYIVTLTATSHGCATTITGKVSIVDIPVPKFVVRGHCLQDSINFIDSSKYGAQYHWDFGDGDSSILKNPAHRYKKAGKYWVIEEVTNATGCMRSIMSRIDVYGSPIARFAAKDICIGDSVYFEDSSQFAVQYHWDFGDGDTSSLMNGRHRYINPGSYTVTLTVRSMYGCTSTFSRIINVNDRPKAAFRFKDACVGENINITDASRGVSSYTWYFGDGTQNSMATHSYAKAGTYTLSLVVRNASGCVDSISNIIHVAKAPKAIFTAANTCYRDSAMFADSSISAVKWHWDFGDGDTSGAHLPKHLYASAGNYKVILTVENGGGCKDTFSRHIFIDSTCVWPGDANKDKMVSAADVLNIGIAYSETGAKRDNATTNWTPQYARDWNKQFKSGADYKHADCNGDGTVDNTDTLAVRKNYSKTHPKALFKNQGSPNDPPLYISFEKDSIHTGDVLYADIYLGSQTKPLPTVYGLVFRLNFDGGIVDNSGTVVDVNGSSLGTELIPFVYNGSSFTDIALTRTDHINTSCNGKIARLTFKIKDSVPAEADKVLLTFSDNKIITYAEDQVPVYMQDDSLRLHKHDSGLHSAYSDAFSFAIYPNPFTLETHIQYSLSEAAQTKVEVLDMLGRRVSLLKDGLDVSGPHTCTWQPGISSAGIYMIKLTIGKHVIIQKIVYTGR